MEKKVKLAALLVANQLDLKGIKSAIEQKPLTDSSSELFYHGAHNTYQYYFNYGVIVFANHTDEEIAQAVTKISQHRKMPTTNWLRDDHEMAVKPGEMSFEFNQVVVNHLDHKVFRIAMFTIAQSVALDHYHEVTENLLTQVKGFTLHLEATGKLSISRRNMLKFIGKALNTQNEIADNIYIFDAPELVWDDEYLDNLHKGLMKHFDLRVRFSEIEYTLRIIEDNLRVFREISHQRESNTLEWIIIILILVEVFDMILSKIF
jgi:uncharacterized Rmd1/YagE family protein